MTKGGPVKYLLYLDDEDKDDDDKTATTTIEPEMDARPNRTFYTHIMKLNEDDIQNRI